MRSTGLQILVITLLIAINHQYKNLQSYFYSLNGIFENSDLDHIKKEELYVESVKVGIRLHAETMWWEFFSIFLYLKSLHLQMIWILEQNKALWDGRAIGNNSPAN